jgi:Glycosyltransferase family 25 (LPS biosynthesis protein)
MLYERGSPPLYPPHSPRWNAPRHYSARARTIIIAGVVVLMLTTLGLLSHYSSPPTNIGRKGDEFDVSRQRKLVSVNEMDEVAYGVPYADEEKDLPTAKQNIFDDHHLGSPRLANATLDFGKIYVLNLETREDRHDEMALIAAASGLQLTFFPGVNSKTLDTQSLPDSYGTDYVILEPAHLACYRGHANIWRQIVEDDVETALIMEDDIDWDLNIREILPRVEDGLARITKDPDPMHDGHCTYVVSSITDD